MKHCPACNTEYRPAFTHCADCGTVLIEGSPPEETTAPKPGFDPEAVPRMVPVYVTNRMHADVIRTLLEGNEIPTIVSKEGYSAAYPLTVGALGEGRVLVREKDRAQALEIISAAEGGDFHIESDAEDTPWAGRAWWVVGIGIVILVVLIIAGGG